MGSPGTARPPRAWFILPSILLLAGALLAGFGISSFVGFGRMAVFGVIAPLFMGLCSIVLFRILAFLRYRSRQTTTAATWPPGSALHPRPE